MPIDDDAVPLVERDPTPPFGTPPVRITAPPTRWGPIGVVVVILVSLALVLTLVATATGTVP